MPWWFPLAATAVLMAMALIAFVLSRQQKKEIEEIRAETAEIEAGTAKLRAGCGVLDWYNDGQYQIRYQVIPLRPGHGLDWDAQVYLDEGPKHLAEWKVLIDRPKIQVWGNPTLQRALEQAKELVYELCHGGVVPAHLAPDVRIVYSDTVAVPSDSYVVESETVVISSDTTVVKEEE